MFTPRSRFYYRIQALLPSGPPEISFVYKTIISCDADGRLYGDVRDPGDFAACSAVPSVNTSRGNLILSDLVGADLVPERLSCEYHITFRYLCEGL